MQILWKSVIFYFEKIIFLFYLNNNSINKKKQKNLFYHIYLKTFLINLL